jgi:hypothetical protein
MIAGLGARARAQGTPARREHVAGQDEGGEVGMDVQI